jgi:hypothetical protein
MGEYLFKARKKCLASILFLIIFFYIAVFNISISAQTVNVPFNNDIYSFLDRLASKEIVHVHNEVKPFSRIHVAALLRQVIKNKRLLNEVEASELDWYSREYASELDGHQSERWHLFNYSDSLFTISADPVFGIGKTATGKYSSNSRWWGGSVYGTYSDWFGASMDFRDNGEYGSNVLDPKFFTPQRGYFINLRTSNGIEYSDVKGCLNFNWKWGYVSLAKDYQQWGHGQYGQLIISDKPASYPFIKLFLQPVEWLRFYYMHGWLTSNVSDSLYFYPIGMERDGKPVYRGKFVDKYIAANFLSISPFRFMDLSLGNSVIYSYPTLRPEYLIPFMLYKFQDHNAGRNNDYGNNGQLFGDIIVRYPKSFSFYATVFIDMLSTTELEDGNDSNFWNAVTVGFNKVDLFADNLDINFEYTRISPRVYEHYIPTTTYKHLDYELGHWLGQNADQMRVQFNYRPSRGLKISLYAERLRKGGLREASDFYVNTYNQPFLEGPLRKDFNIGLDAKYEIIHDLNLSGYYRYSDISDESSTRTAAFLLGKKHSLGFYLYYGMF